MKKIPKEMIERMARAIDLTWDAIYGDCLVDENGNYDESASMTRDEVYEICIDADRVRVYGGTDKEAIEYLYKLPWNVINSEDFKKKMLPFEIYGA